MSDAAYRAARDLLSLRSKYSMQELLEGFTLLRDASQLEEILELSAIKSKQRGKKSQSNNSRARLEKILAKNGGNPRLGTFIALFLEKSILESSGSVRDFSESIGVILPKNLPVRMVIAERFAGCLSEFSEAELDRVLASTKDFDREVSSLRQWSDVITRNSAIKDDKSS